MKSTEVGFVNENNQMNLGCTGEAGTDYGQKLYKLRCLDCGFEYKANGTDIWLRKCPECQKGKKRMLEPVVGAVCEDAMIPESYLVSYEAYMRKMTGDQHCGIIHNDFIDAKSQEGYKAGIVEKANELTAKTFGVKKDKKPKVSEIAQYAIEILDLRQNLINGSLVKEIEDKLKDKAAQNEAAEAIYEIICGAYPERAYEMAGKVFGYRFSLLSYFFFVRDSHEYVPVSPDNFDRIFELFGKEFVDCPKLSRNGTWKTYSTFLKCLSDIKLQLEQKYPDEKVTLLDAHSVLWVMGEKEFISFHKSNEASLPPDQREKDSIVCAKARIGQGEYRRKMIEYWDGKCAVTGCAFTDILMASHAKPWKECDAVECRDPFNGFLLAPNIDALFDKFLISFEDDGAILISPQIDQEACDKLGINKKMRLSKLDDRHRTYLKYHRDMYFSVIKESGR